MCNLFDLTLMECKGIGYSLVAVEISTICAPLLRTRVPRDKLVGFESLHYADDYINNRQVNVDILVGIDAYWKFVLLNQVLQRGGLVAQESVFGWILSGTWNASDSGKGVGSQLLCIGNNVSDSLVHKVCDLRSIEICSVETSYDDSTSNLTQQRFEENVRFCDGKYEVALPWKSDAAKFDLQNNVKLAKKRFDNLCHRCEKDSYLKSNYHCFYRL